MDGEQAWTPISRPLTWIQRKLGKHHFKSKRSVAELPQIPFTIPIRRKLEAAMEPQTDTETNSPELD